MNVVDKLVDEEFCCGAVGVVGVYEVGELFEEPLGLDWSRFPLPVALEPRPKVRLVRKRKGQQRWEVEVFMGEE